MQYRTRGSWVTFVAALLLGLVTVACGERSAPDTPPGAGTTTTPAADTPADTDDAKPAAGSATKPAKPAEEGGHKPAADGGAGGS